MKKKIYIKTNFRLDQPIRIILKKNKKEETHTILEKKSKDQILPNKDYQIQAEHLQRRYKIDIIDSNKYNNLQISTSSTKRQKIKKNNFVQEKAIKPDNQYYFPNLPEKNTRGKIDLLKTYNIEIKRNLSKNNNQHQEKTKHFKKKSNTAKSKKSTSTNKDIEILPANEKMFHNTANKIEDEPVSLTNISEEFLPEFYSFTIEKELNRKTTKEIYKELIEIKNMLPKKKRKKTNIKSISFIDKQITNKEKIIPLNSLTNYFYRIDIEDLKPYEIPDFPKFRKNIPAQIKQNKNIQKKANRNKHPFLLKRSIP